MGLGHSKSVNHKPLYMKPLKQCRNVSGPKKLDILRRIRFFLYFFSFLFRRAAAVTNCQAGAVAGAEGGAVAGAEAVAETPAAEAVNQATEETN